MQIIILLTKADKLAVNARRKALYDVKKQLTEFGGHFDVIPFSGVSNLGVIEARELLSSFYEGLHENNSQEADDAILNYQKTHGIPASATESSSEEEEEPEFDERAWKNFRGL